MTPYTPDWNAVIRILEQRFPRELEVAMLTARVEELEPVANPVEPVDNP